MGKPAKLLAIKNADPIITINQSFGSFSPPEKRCADLILESPISVTQLSISDFASKAKTSEATVVRFCKKIGYPGYPKLRIALATHVGFHAGLTVNDEDEIELGISQADTTADLINKVRSSAGTAVAMTANLVDADVLDLLTEALHDARIIGAFGTGTSSLVAADISYKFNRLGMGCLHWSDHLSALISISSLQKGDVLFVISHSGNAAEAISVATEYKNRGVLVVAITNNSQSALAKMADFLFLTQSEQGVLRVGITVSRIAQLLIVDCIAIATARRSWDISRAALTVAAAAIHRQVNYKDWMYGNPIAPIAEK